MTVEAPARTWHVQQSLDPTIVALMCPWPDCGELSPVVKAFAPELAGRKLNCSHCGLPSIVPDTIKEEALC